MDSKNATKLSELFMIDNLRKLRKKSVTLDVTQLKHA